MPRPLPNFEAIKHEIISVAFQSVLHGAQR